LIQRKRGHTALSIKEDESFVECLDVIIGRGRRMVMVRSEIYD